MEKILVLNIAGIGDCVDSLPALHELRRVNPDAFIRLVVAEKSVPLARCCADVNDVVGLPTSLGRAMPEWVDAPRWLWRVIGLRGRYRLLVDLYGASSRLGRSWLWLLSLWAWAPLIGPDRRTATARRAPRDQVARSLDIVAMITPRELRAGGSREAIFSGLQLPDAATDAVHTWLKEQSWGALTGPLVAVALGGDRQTRHESPQRAERWLALLQAKWKIRPIIIGTKHDPGLPAGSSVIHLDRRGRWEIVQTAALIASADALISTDSAPQHLASVWGIPTVVLLGPGDPIRYRPRFSKERFRQVRHEVPCAPCYYMVCPLRGDDHQRCMSRIAPEQMVDAFGEIVTHSS